MTRNIITKDKILCISIIIYFFIVYLVPQFTLYISLYLLFVEGIYIRLSGKFKIKFNGFSISSFIFLFVSIMGLLAYNPYYNEAVVYIITLILCLLTFYILLNSTSLTLLLFKGIKYLFFFLLLGSIFQLIIPDTLLSIGRIYHTPQRYEEFEFFIRNNKLVGFSHNTGNNGFIISVSLYASFIKLIHSTKPSLTLYNSVSFIGLLVLLFLTEKRGFLLFALVIISLIVFITYRFSFKTILSILFLTVGLLFFLFETNLAESVIIRTIQQDDITTGRMPAYNIMWEDFKLNPILGNGTYTTNQVLSIYNGHNIYLQVLRENGILGFILLIYILLYNLISNSMYLIKYNINNRYRAAMLLSFSVQLLFVFWGITGNPLYDTYPLFLYVISVAGFYIVKNRTLNNETYNISNGGTNENSNNNIKWVF